MKILRRSSRGAAIAGSLRSTDAALRELSGEPIESINLSWHLPGSYRITIRTGSSEVRLTLDGDGARIDRLGVRL